MMAPFSAELYCEVCSSLMVLVLQELIHRYVLFTILVDYPGLRVT